MPGINAELHCINERMVGSKPQRLDFAQAAAISLTALTALQLLFERMGVRPGASHGEGETLLIVGAAGGVGSMLIQLVRRLTAFTVVATASRDASRGWCLALGVHQVIDPRQSLPAQNVPPVTQITCLTHTANHLSELIELIQPPGKLGVIDDHVTFDAAPLKGKILSLHWEMVFAYALYQTRDLDVQHQTLDRVAVLIDHGLIRTTLTQSLRLLNTALVHEAHWLIEVGEVIDKIVVSRLKSPSSGLCLIR